MAWDGAKLWLADWSEGEIHEIDSDGNVVSSFDSPGPSPTGLAWDGSRLWHADWSEGKVYVLEVTEKQPLSLMWIVLIDIVLVILLIAVIKEGRGEGEEIRLRKIPVTQSFPGK